MKIFIVYFAAVLTSLHSTIALADTVVTTYISDVQEERKSTRWTLTEWLRIKERMKMMDVWLAMFSDPKKDVFHPELNLSFSKYKGLLRYTPTTSREEDNLKVDGATAQGQLWLTNIFTGTTGAHFLNIDFGAEGTYRSTDSFNRKTKPVKSKEHSMTRSYYSGDFRIFGKNIQDSSLVLKVGQYTVRNHLSETADWTINGLLLGAELQLYVFKWLGAEGNYLNFEKGSYYDYGGYVEISLLRLFGGAYQESWDVAPETNRPQTDEKGYFAGAKVQF